MNGINRMIHLDSLFATSLTIWKIVNCLIKHKAAVGLFNAST